MPHLRTNFALCLASAVLGAAAATVWFHAPSAIPQAQAQEPLQFPAGPIPGGPAVRVQPGATPYGQPLPSPAAAQPPADELTPEERVHVAVYEACNKSVVNINTKVATPTMFLIDVVQDGAGSGSVIDKLGHILTNYHVVEGAKEIQVTLFDGKSYDARVVGRDPSTDVSVLKIEAPAESLHPLRLGDSSRLKVGQRVYAIGNPFGLERTLTTGIVSSLNRSLPARNNRTIKSIIQIDAAINPGNSGGPLIDSRGRVIGMNTAIASRSGQSAGVGFAIPSSVIGRVVPELITSGRVVRPETGIERVYETEKGLVIATLIPGGPAEQAGLRGFKLVTQRKRQGPFVYDSKSVDRSSADTIVAVSGQPTPTADDFLSAIDSHHPGQEVVITILREGRETPVRVRLAAAEE